MSAVNSQELSNAGVQEEKLAKIGPLLESHQRRDKALVELERLDEVRLKVLNEGGYVNYKEVCLASADFHVMKVCCILSVLCSWRALMICVPTSCSIS